MSVSVVAGPRNHNKDLENIEVFEGFFMPEERRIWQAGKLLASNRKGLSL